MNVELLQRIKQQILEEPRRFNMYDWVRTNLVDEHDRLPRLELTWGRSAFLYSAPERVPPCQTAACIGGWAVLLEEFNGDVKAMNAQLRELDTDYASYTAAHAQRLLDLTEGQVSRLFYPDKWREGFDARYGAAMTARDQTKAAQVAAEYIDRFIETDGWSELDDDDSNIDEHGDPVVEFDDAGYDYNPDTDAGYDEE